MKQEIKKIVLDATKKTYPHIDPPEFIVEDAEEKFGDYSANVAMILSGVVGESPEEIAKRIIKEINEIESRRGIIESIEYAKPGFINFKILVPYLNKKILEIISAGKEYGSSELGNDFKVNIEFISANPTGPLTLGNGRGGYHGDVLANVFSKFGAKVTREYYINDRGAQVLALGHSVLKDDKAIYKGKYIDEIAEKISSKEPTAVGNYAAEILTNDYIKKTIIKMGIKFDKYFSEKEMYDLGKVSEMIEELNQNKLTYTQDGALWLKTTEFSDDKDRVLVTKEGEYTYFASDISYHYNKITRGYDLLLNYWGADHHGYIGRMKSAVEILKKDTNWSGKLDIIVCQLVRLVSKGQEVKMSKREGTYVTLDELLDEVGPDVTRFFFLDRSLNTHMDFDLDLAKEQSQKNPVYYVQYAYARIASILNKHQISNIKYQISRTDGLMTFAEIY